jgi:non-lysosomal glucosylceramidase
VGNIGQRLLQTARHLENVGSGYFLAERQATGKYKAKLFWTNTMRNDPFHPPRSALARDRGHVSVPARPKQPWLFKPLGPTGVPLGGLGTGTITRASDGRFSRWTIKAGGVRQFDMPANGFMLRVAREGHSPEARALQSRPDGPEMSAFAFEEDAPAWHGLFPLAWHRHAPLDGVEAEALSFSPVIAGDIETSGLPVALFKWRLTNSGSDVAEVSLGFSFANLNGWFGDVGEGRPHRVAAGCFNAALDGSHVQGVALNRSAVSDPPPEGTGQWAIGFGRLEGLHVTRTLAFDAQGSGAEIWDAFVATGDAPDLGAGWHSEAGFRETAPAHPAGFIAARCTLAAGETRDLTAVLAWDLPTIRFGQGRAWHRAYTEHWGTSGQSAGALADHALASADDWLRRIETWQASQAALLGDTPHRAGMAINESYFLTEGLTVLTRPDADGRAHFGLIECHDYALYNTMDLWVYAAEAVARWFPDLAAGVAAEFARHTLADDCRPRRHRWDGTIMPLNPGGACPHDLGGPDEDPFVRPNSYTYRDATLWKDLNCDLVLCLYREGRVMGADWRRAQFPAVVAALDHLQVHDRDGDGLIENDGTPDQTFDNLPMKGPSSYCGGLWIAALLAGAALAEEAGEAGRAGSWRAQADRARAAFVDRLWNGDWFRVDTEGVFSDALFIEQLLGPFLARRLGLGDIVPEDMARRALTNLYQISFLEAGRGQGAVSLARVPDSARAHLPHQDDTTFQTAEIQPGFNFSLAAQFEAWGLDAEADHLRRVLHHELHVARNLVFQTPAAFDAGRPTCRAVLNMRPMSVWWMAPFGG